MVWLQSNERINELIEYDPNSGNWQQYDRTTTCVAIPSETDGFYSFLSSVLCAVFKSGQRLFVQIGDVGTELSNRVVVNVTGSPSNRRLTVIEDGTVLVDHLYSLRRDYTHESDPTPFVEDEDFDFGLFMANVARSPARQDVMKGIA